MDKEKEVESRALTIEDLKALSLGDWIWLVDKKYSCNYYVEIHSSNMSELQLNGNHCNHDEIFSFSDYGTEWLAYKNKEEAENSNYGNVAQAIKGFAEKAEKICDDYHLETKEIVMKVVCMAKEELYPDDTV